MIFCISSAVLAESSARLRISDATTEKPLPCSPARAASIDAFKDNRFVWDAMFCISLTNSAISSSLPASRMTCSCTSLVASAVCLDCLAISSTVSIPSSIIFLEFVISSIVLKMLLLTFFICTESSSICPLHSVTSPFCNAIISLISSICILTLSISELSSLPETMTVSPDDSTSSFISETACINSRILTTVLLIAS